MFFFGGSSGLNLLEFVSLLESSSCLSLLAQSPLSTVSTTFPTRPSPTPTNCADSHGDFWWMFTNGKITLEILMTIQFQHVWASNLVISLASEDDRTLSWIPVPRPLQAKHLSCQANLEMTTPLIQGVISLSHSIHV